MPGEGIYEIVGKAIERVIIKEHRNERDYPAMQVFLIFTDHTYYELYGGDSIGFTGSVYPGGREEVLRYLNKEMAVVYEAYLDEQGEPTKVEKRKD